jgi:insulysin
MDEIIQLIFQYLKLIRISGIQEWIYEEQSRLSEIEFAFEDERNAIGIVSKVASCMRHYPMKEVLSGGILMEEFNPQLIKFVLDMLTVENMRIIIVDQNFYYKCNLKEEIYGTKYGVEKVGGAKANIWKFCGLDEKLKIPEKNLFIPESFDFLPIENWKQVKKFL